MRRSQVIKTNKILNGSVGGNATSAAISLIARDLLCQKQLDRITPKMGGCARKLFIGIKSSFG